MRDVDISLWNTCSDR